MNIASIPPLVKSEPYIDLQDTRTTRRTGLCDAENAAFSDPSPAGVPRVSSQARRSLGRVPIERFIWTTHAEDKRAKRLLDRRTVEHAIRGAHADRQINHGRADWLIRGLMADGRRFEVVYDHPCGRDHAAVRIVSVWDL
jgi:hypothetical protein